MSTEGGFGVKIMIAVGTTMTAIAHVTEMTYPEFEKFLYERTAHDSPGRFAEHGDSGKRKVNPFTCKLEWDKEEATHAAILAAFDSPEPVEISIEDPDSSDVITGHVQIQKVGREAKQESGYFCTVTLQPTGLWS
jgi:hypothetical protein